MQDSNMNEREWVSEWKKRETAREKERETVCDWSMCTNSALANDRRAYTKEAKRKKPKMNYKLWLTKQKIKFYITKNTDAWFTKYNRKASDRERENSKTRHSFILFNFVGATFAPCNWLKSSATHHPHHQLFFSGVFLVPPVVFSRWHRHCYTFITKAI